MKIKTLSIACICGLAMCSCMSVLTGYGPDGTAADLISNAPVTKHDITFSVDFSADLGPDNWFDQEEIVLAILNWTMSCLVRGKEVYSASSQQTVTDYVWLPFALTTPFMNHSTMGGGMKTKPLQYFVREIRDRKLNDIQ